MNFDQEILLQGSQFLQTCRLKKLKLVTAESCTGGLIASLITAVVGSSDVFDRGFVTYSNDAKVDCLGVPISLINQFGAVSAQVAKVMAEGALANSSAHLSLSVTGIAGPGGGTEQKPVGLVFIGSTLIRSDTIVEKNIFSGDRDAVRNKTVAQAITILDRQARTYQPVRLDQPRDARDG